MNRVPRELPRAPHRGLRTAPPLALPVALALLILALPLYGGGQPEPGNGRATADRRPQTSSARDGASAHDEALLSIGVRPVDAAVPGADVEFALLAGEPAHATFGSYAGRLVLVNYWATWCEPCRLEMPSMQRLHENFADRGVVVLAMNYGESAEQVRQYIEAEGYTFPVGLDPNREVANRFGVRGLPTNYLIGANGRIIGTKVGFRFWDTPDVFRAVEQLLESQ